LRLRGEPGRNNANGIVPAFAGTQVEQHATSVLFYGWLSAFDSSFAVISTIGITRS